MSVRGSFRSAYAVFGVFFAVAVVSTTALGWLVSEQFRHDAVVDAQRQREQLIQAADATVGSMQRALFEIEALVRAGDVTLASVPRGVSLVMLGNDSATVNPRGSLLFMPVRGAASREAPTHLFAPAERLEFGERRPDLSAALHTYSKVARRVSFKIDGNSSAPRVSPDGTIVFALRAAAKPAEVWMLQNHARESGKAER